MSAVSDELRRMAKRLRRKAASLSGDGMPQYEDGLLEAEQMINRRAARLDKQKQKQEGKR